MRVVSVLVVTFIFVLLTGCSSQPESREDYLKKRGVQYIKIGNTELTARLLNLSTSKTDSLYSNSDYLYFDVTINRLSGEKFEKDKTIYLDFDMQKDFVTAIERDSLAPSFCQKIETGKSQSYEYIIAFPKPTSLVSNGITLVYNDKIFGVGQLAFVYQASDLKNLEPKS